MTLVYSGQISLGDIADEFGSGRSNVSLRERSSLAGKGIPDAMSEFYGYTAPKASFQMGTQVNGPNQTTASGSLVTYKPNVVITLTVFGGINTGAAAYGTYFINGLTTMRTPASGNVTQYNTMATTYSVATAGTRSAALTIYPVSGVSSQQFAKIAAS